MNTMVDVYCRLIKAGKKTITDVPEIHKQEVQAILDAEITN